MVNNKILTVSYGTFSCTLEGFDDSFGTMKAIAEYFRDLAADDRYFGAEPPSPDADMLARIAEREISRRVEAHREDNTFVLKADAGSVLPVAAKAATLETQEGEASEQAPAPETAEISTEAPVRSESDAPSEPAVAETPQEAFEEDRTEDTPTEPSAPEADLSGLSALVAESVAARSDASADLATSLATEDETEDEAADTAEEKLEAGDQAVEPAPAGESVAEKLQRIRDVVSKSEAESAYSEDEHADDLLLDDDDATEPFLSEQSDGLSSSVDEDTQDVAASQIDNAEEAFDDEFEDEADEDDISAILSRFDAADTAKHTALNEPEADDAEAPPRARVIKMKKADFEAAIEDGYIEEEEENAGGDAGSSLSAEEEDELMRELAEVEAELGALDADDEDDDQIDEDLRDDVQEPVDAELDEDLDDDLDDDIDGDDTAGNLFSDDDQKAPRHEHFAQDTDVEMGRILNETNSQLQEETGKGRRNAIAHLRAAVAATQAERGAGGDLSSDGRDTVAYRDDLETVVRPRRPEARAHTARPSAPLKLVAEQRIDTPAPAAPVQPRRVRTAAASAAKPQQHGFADYIDDVGAYNLGEVLEAAASYMAFVEGKEAFSRPQLMSKLNETEHADSPREDRLRSFGQLLREGKIRKLGGGRFEAAEHISYQPKSRVAGE